VTLVRDSGGAAYIQSLIVTGSIGGPSGATSSITAPGGINVLEAASINANISTADSGADGPVHRIVTTSSTPYSANMNLYRLRKHPSLTNPGIILGGALTGKITIPHDLKDDTSIQLPASGLQGQIVVNSYDASTAWAGFVKVDGITLSPDTGVATSGNDVAPYYARASSGLGGGAVGLAPFMLYRSDCVPVEPAPAGALAATSATLVPSSFGGSTPPISIPFYGPVQRITGSAYAWSATSDIIVECIPLSYAGSPCAYTGGWLDLTGGFTLHGPTSSAATGTAARTLTLGASGTNVISPGIYRVQFMNVGCAGVTGTPPIAVDAYCSGDPDSSQAYYFRVGSDCDNYGGDDTIQSPPPAYSCATGCADFNHVDGVTVADIFDFLNAWFAGCRAPTTTPPTAPCFGDADFNGDHTLAVSDIFAYLNAWFIGNSNCI
jgi:hypothetical protein